MFNFLAITANLIFININKLFIPDEKTLRSKYYMFKHFTGPITLFNENCINNIKFKMNEILNCS